MAHWDWKIVFCVELSLSLSQCPPSLVLGVLHSPRFWARGTRQKLRMEGREDSFSTLVSGKVFQLPTQAIQSNGQPFFHVLWETDSSLICRSVIKSENICLWGS